MKTPRISFEFFPPKTLEASFRLWETIHTLAPLDPRFVSVTYGAGGTTRELTREAVGTLHKATGLNVAAHLTCVDASREEVDEVVRQYWETGVRHFVALRGDGHVHVRARRGRRHGRALLRRLPRPHARAHGGRLLRRRRDGRELDGAALHACYRPAPRAPLPYNASCFAFK